VGQYGASCEEFTGLRPKDFFQHDIQYGREVWRKFFDQGRLHIETNERKLDGTPIWVEGDYICLYDDMGNITGHFGVQRDVTERKEATLKQAEMQVQIERYAAKLEKEVTQRTAELERSEARLRAIINAMPDLIFVLDEDGRYQEILTTATDLLHQKMETLKGKRIQDVVPSPNADLFSAVIEQTLESGKAQIIEYQLTVPAGRCWFEGRTGIVNITFDKKKCIVFVVRDITDRKRAEELERQNIYLQEEIRSEHNYGEIVGLSKPMQAVFKHIDIVSATDSTVLLTGETGTGKELLARAIHGRSGRQERSMIKVNYGAMPSGLVESELFGHEKGAFTGATLQKKGKFELAHRGTIFLDEIGELPHDIQVKLLRVLQEQEFERVGGMKTIKVDVRVIAATNRDLHEAVQRGAFRSDLFFRLNIFPIQVPPLRERMDDILPLANFFISKFAKSLGKHIKGIHQMTLNKLSQYHWPGNVRELANILERAVILCQGNMLQKEHICGLMATKALESEGMTTLDEVERRYIVQVLEKTGGVLGGPNGAVTILGMKRSTLWSRMQKLGITVSKEIYKNQS
jgi:formate hydrogenlyase transcriptional activator